MGIQGIGKSPFFGGFFGKGKLAEIKRDELPAPSPVQLASPEAPRAGKGRVEPLPFRTPIVATPSPAIKAPDEALGPPVRVPGPAIDPNPRPTVKNPDDFLGPPVKAPTEDGGGVAVSSTKTEDTSPQPVPAQRVDTFA